MAMLWLQLILGTLITLVYAGCSFAPVKPASMIRNDYSYTKEYIRWQAEKEMFMNDVAGLSIALVDDQSIVWAEGFGMADREMQLQASSGTLYRVGSISKLFTVTSAMQLAEVGKLDIDKPLKDYLPEFFVKRRFPDTAPVTPRSLMTHHSGLPSDYLKGMWTKQAGPYADLLKLLRDEYAPHPPNKVFAYSNLGMTLLGLAEERITGQDFPSLIQSALLQPMGMGNSSFSAGAVKSAGVAKAYAKGKLAEEPELRDLPAGGLNSNVIDLSRFMQTVFAGGFANGNRVISSESLAEMLRPQNSGIPLDLDFKVGLGWMLSGLGGIDIKNAGTVAHHSGATLYHRSILVMLPEHKLGVVVLANSSTAGPVVSRLAETALTLALEAKAGIIQPPRIPRIDLDGDISDNMLDGYEGRYATMAGVVPVVRKSGYLQAELLGIQLRLVPGADGLFTLKYELFGLFPISLGELDFIGVVKDRVAGHDILKARLDGKELLIGRRIKMAPISRSWQERVGEYEIVNFEGDAAMLDSVQLKNDHGLLVVEYAMPLFFQGRLSFAVEPISDNEALIYGFGRSTGETLHVSRIDGIEVIRYSGYILKRKSP